MLETEAYQLYEGKVSVPELRALTLKHYMQHRKLYLGDDELIVGEKSEGPQIAPTFPELCCHTLEDMRIMDARELIRFEVNEDQIDAQRDTIAPYWAERSMRDKILSAMTPEWKALYEAGVFTEFMEQRGPGHTVGSSKIYEKGFLEKKCEIELAIQALDSLLDPTSLARAEQLRAMAVACDAIMILGDRYANLAREMATKQSDPRRKTELEQIVANCEVVPRHRPETFHQAIQMYWFVHLCVTTELNPWDAYSPGRLDQHLNPFYLRDTDSGLLDDSRALELLECLWVKFNNQPAPPKVGITLKESSTYTDFANINTGGIREDGQDGVNDVSYLILACMDEMKLLQPSSNVQISKKTPRHFLLRACEISRKGWGQPAFYNTEAIVAELMNAGKSLKDARKGGTSGCVETGAFGAEAYILTGYFNIPKAFELTLHHGIDPQTGAKIGLDVGGYEEYKTFEQLYAAFEKQMEYLINIKMCGSNEIEQMYAKYMPVPFLSVITNDCIERGMDYNAGGARYNTSYLQGVGIATIADILAAIKLHVYEQKNCSMEQLMQALEANFEGHERLHGQLLNQTPKYGNDDEYADRLMQRVFESYLSFVNGKPNTRGGQWRVNMLPTTCHVYFGEVLGATANGRKAHKPLSEGISPTQGADTRGPSAVVKSAAKMDHLMTGGTLLNQKFTPKVLAGDSGLSHMANLVRAYFDMDGHHIQFNVVDKRTLLEAQNHPEEHRDLIVRVAGYSDHFRNLSRALQDEIIERTEQSV